jgi:glycosyltransferase involved in cell wall biosynthesis
MQNNHSYISKRIIHQTLMAQPTDRPIYINGRFLAQNRTGVQRYSREVVVAIDRLLARNDCPPGLAALTWQILAPPGTECDLDLSKIQFRVVGSGGGHLWEQLYLARYARSGCLLSPAASGPLLHPRQLVVIHDAAIYKAPAGFTRNYRMAHKVLDRVLARTAKIATVSHFSRLELAACLHIPASDIVLAPNGTDHFQSLQPDPDIVCRLNLTPAKYFVTLGLSTANKNIALAVEAFSRLNRPDTRLVVVGKGSERVANAANFKNDQGVLFTGRLTDEEVAALLRSATALLFPSRYEGFGMPLLEAMAQGCPVIASTAGAALEVCGDAALHFDPDNVYALADHMTRMLQHPEVAATLRPRGFAQPQKYQWAAAAAALMQGLQGLDRGTMSEGVAVATRDYKTTLPLR